MTKCAVNSGPCCCQPDDGTPCPNGTPAQVQAALNAESMALRKDAARYRKWREEYASGTDTTNAMLSALADCWTPDAVDEVIDAAMAAAPAVGAA